MGNALSFNNSSTICVVSYFCQLLCVTLFTFLFLCLLNSLTYYPSCAVSRKQMRNLKYRLRYTGLTLWPCWMHQIPNIITRCTEPFGIHHQSLCAVSPPWLLASVALHAITSFADRTFTLAWVEFTPCCTTLQLIS